MKKAKPKSDMKGIRETLAHVSRAAYLLQTARDAFGPDGDYKPKPAAIYGTVCAVKDLLVLSFDGIGELPITRTKLGIQDSLYDVLDTVFVLTSVLKHRKPVDNENITSQPAAGCLTVISEHLAGIRSRLATLAKLGGAS